MGYRVFSAGQYKIRQRGNKYYVYKLENDDRGNVRERYVAPLDKVFETYLEVVGGTPYKEVWRYPSKWTGRDLNPGPLGCKPSTLPG